MSIRQALGFSESESAWSSVSAYLKRFYIESQAEADRRDNAQARSDFYRDRGVERLERILAIVYDDPNVIRDRKAWSRWARFDNAIKRIVNELSTVYSEPALRTVDSGNDAYQKLVADTRLDHMMRRANRWLNLHNDVLLWFRARETPRGLMPRVDVLAPNAFYAVSSPTDPTLLVGLIIDQTPQQLTADADVPHYAFWTDSEVVRLNKAGTVLTETLTPNPYGRIPGLLLHREPPDDRLLDGTSGDDLVSAHVAGWFIDVLLMKESRTINKQVAFGGDLATTATGQTQDVGRDMMLAEGVTAQTIDRTIDLGQFRNTADHIIERAAANYGIPPSVLRHSGANSGLEIELRRIGLRERRRDQIMIFRPAEKAFAEIQSIVTANALPEYAFSMAGWRIDFGEVEAPRDPISKLRFREQLRTMGLANTIDFIMEDNPDLSFDQAGQELARNVSVEILRNTLMRPLAEMNGSASQSVDTAATPEENGASAE